MQPFGFNPGTLLPGPLDLPLVLSVSGHIRRTDDGIDGADQSLLCDNAPGVPGRYPGIGGIPDIDRTGL